MSDDPKHTKYTDDEIRIRPAVKQDMKDVMAMIQELAEFEKMPDGPKLSLEDLEQDGFGRSPPSFKCMVASLHGPQNKETIVGYSLYFPTYSTWEGRSLMMEDLYVRPSERGKGVGERLFNHVASEASQLGCQRMDFHVLEWNPAREFYESRGALNLTSREHWCYYRLAGAPLRQVASRAVRPPPASAEPRATAPAPPVTAPPATAPPAPAPPAAAPPAIPAPAPTAH